MKNIFIGCLGLFIICDSFSVGLGPVQRLAYVGLFGLTALLLVLGPNPIRIATPNRTITLAWIGLFLVGWLMTILQPRHIQAYIVADAMSLIFPVLIFLLATKEPKIFTDRKSFIWLYVMMLIAVVTATQFVTHTNRFFEPPLLLIVLAWYFAARAQTVRAFVLHFGITVFLLMMTLMAGARMVVLLWFLIGAIFFFLGFFSRRNAIVVSIGVGTLALFALAGAMHLDVLGKLADTRLGSLVTQGLDSDLVESVTRDESMYNRFLEADDALQARWNDDGPLALIFGTGHGATFDGKTATYRGRLTDDGYAHHIHIGIVLMYIRYGIFGVLGVLWAYCSGLRCLIANRFRGQPQAPTAWREHEEADPAGTAADDDLMLDDQTSAWYDHQAVFIITMLAYLMNFMLFNELLSPLFSFSLAGFLFTRTRPPEAAADAICQPEWSEANSSGTKRSAA